MKLIQLLLAFAGGSFAIHEGLTGYSVGFFALMSAIIGTMIIVKIQEWGSR
jgi:hypothetical protein